MRFTSPIPFAEALRKLGAKTVITSSLDTEDWQTLVPTALRDRAFWSSQIESAKFLQRAKSTIEDFLSGNKEVLPNGSTALKTGSRAQFISDLRAFAIENGLGPIDPEDAGTLKDITSAKRLGLIFNVQTQQAHDFGYWQQGQDADVLNEFPAQRFIRDVEVSKPRAIHAQNEGVVRLKTDVAFWRAMNSPQIGGFDVPWGPWGFNSGMGVEDVDRQEAESLGLIEPGQKIKPVDKSFNAELQADTKNLDPALVDKLKAAFGNQVKVLRNKIEWSK